MRGKRRRRRGRRRTTTTIPRRLTTSHPQIYTHAHRYTYIDANRKGSTARRFGPVTRNALITRVNVARRGSSRRVPSRSTKSHRKRARACAHTNGRTETELFLVPLNETWSGCRHILYAVYSARWCGTGVRRDAPCHSRRDYTPCGHPMTLSNNRYLRPTFATQRFGPSMTRSETMHS